MREEMLKKQQLIEENSRKH